MDPAAGGPKGPERLLALVRGDPERHRAAAEATLTRARAGGPPEDLVLALHAVAWVEHEAMANRLALDLLSQSLDLAEVHAVSHAVGDLLLSRVAVLHELGRLDEAHADLDRATALVPAEASARLALQQAALVHAGGGTGAAAQYERLVASDVAPAEVRVKAANNLAHIRAAKGRYTEAVRLVDDALELAAEVGETLAAYLTHTRAWLVTELGRPTEGLAGFHHARALFEHLGIPLGEHLAEYSDALAQLRLLPEARQAATEAADLLADEAPLAATEVRLRVARLQHATGDSVAALETATRARAEFARQGRAIWEARAAVVVASATTPPDAASLRAAAAELDAAGLLGEAVGAHLAAGLAEPGHESLASLRAVERRSRGVPLTVRLQVHRASAELALRSGSTAESLRRCRAGLALLDDHRAALPSAELRALASGHGVELARLGLRTLLPDAAPARVLGWLELMRAAAVAVAATDSSDRDPELARLRALHAELAGSRALAEPDPPQLLAEVAAAEDRVRRAAWVADGGAQGAAEAARRMGLRQLRDRLEDRVLVEYAELDGDLLAVVAGRHPTRLVPLGPLAPVARTTAALQFALRRLADPGADAQRTATVMASARAAIQRLVDLLVRPLALEPGTPLVIAPVGVLQQVPWPALHPAPVSVAPSASIWAATTVTRQQPAGRSGVVLVAGPGLPGAEDEVARLRHAYPDATVLGGGRANAREVLAALATADLAHLSCHGTVRSDGPVFSSLEMVDGPLTLHEILSTAEAPERVVLAACHSAVETVYPGDEGLGFVSALLGHGARAVVASSVLVPDVGAVPLMVALHHGIARGLTAAEALHDARRHIDSDSAAGFVASCAFVAFGAG